VPGACQELQHKYGDIPRAVARHDAIVDLFQEHVSTPTFEPTGERWTEDGYALPWHLALDSAQVKDAEGKLQDLGLPVGAGLFAWRARGTRPAASEAAPLAATLQEQVTALEVQQRRLDRLLQAVCKNAGGGIIADDPSVVAPLLRAGGSPDYQASSTTFTPLTMAVQIGAVQVAKALLGQGADLTIEGFGGKTAFEAIDVIQRDQPEEQKRVVASMFEVFREALAAREASPQSKPLRNPERLPRIDYFEVGGRVQVAEAFNSDTMPPQRLEAGLQGTIQEIVGTGLVLRIMFDGLNQQQFVRLHNQRHLQVMPAAEES